MNKQSLDVDINPDELFEVLENQATLDAVRQFLSDKQLAHSAPSWEKMISSRIAPALKSNTIRVDEIIGIIREAEEHGRKHIRLFQFDADHLGELKEAIEPGAVSAWAKERDFPELGEYIFAAYPTEPVVTEIRVGDGADTGALILKVARTEYRRKKAELVEMDGTQVYLAARIPFRAVDVLKIGLDGLLEVRLSPRSEPPISYQGVAEFVLSQVAGLVDRFRIAELSLSPAKNAFSDHLQKEQLAKDFELYETQHKNDRGDRIQSASQAHQGGIYTSEVMTNVIDHFTSEAAGGYCERVRVSFVYQKTKKINTILSEDLNEIIFTAALSRDEYDIILNEVLRVNRGA